MRISRHHALIDYAWDKLNEWERLADSACAAGFCGSDLQRVRDHFPGQLQRFIDADERRRAQLSLDLMEAVNAGFAGGPAYSEVAQRLVNTIKNV